MKKNNTHHTEDCCKGTLYSYVVKCLFEANPSMLSNEAFHDWKKSFTRIHGELDTQHKVNSKELETIFHISIASGDALFSLIFCLETWHYAYMKYILCPHTSQSKMYPVGKDVLRQLPKMEAYLLSFKKELEDRKGFTSMDEQIHQDYYYTLQRIGEYTFSRYKVCWRYISKSFTPAVVEYADDKYLGTKTIIGNGKIIFIGLDDCDEVYYLCGIISSTPYRKTIENYMVGTQITPSIINKLRIPSFNRDNAFQQKISELCKQGHQEDHKQPYIDAIDKVVNNWLFSSSDV